MPDLPEVHPAAAAWPMLPEDELRELAASIEEVGLLEALVRTPDGLLLDGRNRFVGCQLANVEPTWVVYEGDPTAYVLAKADARRHMEPAPRTMAVAMTLAAAGQRQNGRWAHRATQMTAGGHLSRQRLFEAGVVLDHAPELAPRVVAGELGLKEAAERARVAKAEAEASAERLAALPDDLRVLVHEQVRGLRDAEAEAELRARLGKLDDYLADRVRQGHDTIESAEAAMGQGMANVRADVEEAARVAKWLRRAAGYPLADALVCGYHGIEPLSEADQAVLRAALDALPQEAP